MNYLKNFIKGSLQSFFYYSILTGIAVFNIPFKLFFYAKNIFKDDRSAAAQSARQDDNMERAS